MGKRRKTQAASVEEDADEEEPELTGFVQDGELCLRCAAGHVYSSERDGRGRLVVIGTWDAASKALVPLPPPPSEPSPPGGSSGLPAPQPRQPAPAPAPLAFDADELDHCETAPETYLHVAPLLTELAHSLGVTPAALRVYDPYFCNGAVARHMAELGFESVYNRNEDFYAAAASGQTPPFDVLLTNPPYSADHPERLLSFCTASRRPWLMLCPNWVYERPYFTRLLRAGNGGGGPSGGASRRRAESGVGDPHASPAVFFLVPRKRYHYWTPRGRRTDLEAGTGKAKTHGHTNAALGVRTSPFISFWAGGGFPRPIADSLRAPAGCMLEWDLARLPPGVRDGAGGGVGHRPAKRSHT